MRARARPRANQNIQPEVFQCRIQDLLNIRLQPVNLIDKEDLPRPHVAQNASQIQLFLQDRPGGLIDRHAQFMRDDAGERGFTQPRRSAKQNVIHCLAPAFGRFNRDRQAARARSAGPQNRSASLGGEPFQTGVLLRCEAGETVRFVPMPTSP